jgi:DNA polymerase alpha subunit B
MTDSKENLHAAFDPTGAGLPPDILDVLESTRRLHSLSADELFIKWEVYCLKMGGEDTKLDLPTARMFAKDVQDGVERGEAGTGAGAPPTAAAKKSDRKSNATPRAVGTGDVFGMYVLPVQDPEPDQNQPKSQTKPQNNPNPAQTAQAKTRH